MYDLWHRAMSRPAGYHAKNKNRWTIKLCELFPCTVNDAESEHSMECAMAGGVTVRPQALWRKGECQVTRCQVLSRLQDTEVGSLTVTGRPAHFRQSGVCHRFTWPKLIPKGEICFCWPHHPPNTTNKHY